MNITTVQLHPDLREELRKFIDGVERFDGSPPLSEYKVFRLDGTIGARERVSLTPDGEIVGYCQAAWHGGNDATTGHWALEVVVQPEVRDTRIAADLIESLRVEDTDADMMLWARYDYVAAAATATGWNQRRELWEMRRVLPIDADDEFALGFELATFRMGVDEAAWLEANNAAFAGHPENGHITRRDLEHRLSQPWFDQNGFFLAWKGDKLVGSCWTKIHDDGVGEIYIIGVVPGWEGSGLGRGLVARGLRYLGNERHLTKAMLFVEASNSRAAALYGELGFETVRVVRAYRYEPNV